MTKPTLPSLGSDVTTILEAWRMLAEQPQHRLQAVFGIVGGIGEFVWKDGALWRTFPRDKTLRPINYNEKLQMSFAIREGNFQVSTCEYGSMLDPMGPAYTELKIHHQATRVPLPDPPVLWCEDPMNLFDEGDI